MEGGVMWRKEKETRMGVRGEISEQASGQFSEWPEMTCMLWTVYFVICRNHHIQHKVQKSTKKDVVQLNWLRN